MGAPLEKIGAPLTRQNMPCASEPSSPLAFCTNEASVSLPVTSAK
jgi:hypothetical protein